MAIEDQQQFKDMANLAKTMRLAKELFPEFVGMTDEEADSWQTEIADLRTLPNRFNEVFLSRGWVFTAHTSTTAAEEALRIASSAGVEAAEEYLERYYEENWWFLSHHLFVALKECPQIGLRNAVARQDLIELAWQDHKEKRYHASVPVVAAQIEGIAQDLTGRTFYQRKDTTHLQANETLASDSTALPELAKLMSQGRTETTIEPLEIPQRHGVLHGRDLGYDTRRTSTQAFATLLAMTELIVAITKGEQFKIPEPEFFDPETVTLEDVMGLWNDMLESVEQYSEWKRRDDASQEVDNE